MTAQLIPALVYRDFTNGGEPLAFGLVYTYAAGTTTPQATYVDSTQTTPNTNPVVLNARGESPIWLNPALSYKFVVTDSNGNTIRTVDNVTNLTQATIGQILNPRTSQEIAANITPTNYLYPERNILRYAADPTGMANSTGPINAAISVAKQYVLGAEVYMPTGSYAVTTIDMSSATSNFGQTISLVGDGRYMTSIIPYSAGNILISAVGRVQAEYRNFTVNSSTYVSQCAFFSSRSSTSGSSDQNTFIDFNIEGSYSIGGMIVPGSEEIFWQAGRIANTNSTPNNGLSSVCYFAGGGTGTVAYLTNTLGLNGYTGGTLADGPCTSNMVSGMELYVGNAGQSNSTPLVFYQSADYAFSGLTIISGVNTGSHLITLMCQAGTASFQGPITFNGYHFEANASGTVILWQNSQATVSSNSPATYIGIGFFGGYLEINSNTSFVDFDRTNVYEIPVNIAWSVSSPSVPNNTTGVNFYAYVFQASTINFFPDQAAGSIFVSGYLQQSQVNAYSYNGGVTGHIGCTHTSVYASALPTSGTYTAGEILMLQQPVPGAPTTARCTVSGTLGNCTAGTATTVAGSNQMVLLSAGNIAEGQLISIGSAGLYNVRKWVLSTLTAYLDNTTSIASASGQTVAFIACTLIPGLPLPGSGGPTAVTNGSTIPTALVVERCTVATASTGNILTAGTYDGQTCTIVNQSASADSITMAVAGTSNVADGASCVIAGIRQVLFTWDAATSLWYH
jgi:hypothetical protein